jgi:hypothetical protein
MRPGEAREASGTQG